MIPLSLRDSILNYTGITDIYIGDLITGILFTVTVLLLFALFSKFIFRM